MNAAEPTASKPARRRGAWIALAIVALVVIAVVGVLGWGLSERGLPFIVDRIVARSGGRVSVEGASGSIAGTMRFRRVTWHGADATLVADDVVVDWNPGTLLHRHLSIHGLGARRVDLAIKPSQGAPTPPPTDLRLPLAVDIDRLAIGELDWHTGPRSGRISGLELGYSGDERAHHIRDLALVSEYGALRGSVDVGARAPLDVSGHATLDGDGTIKGAHADITLNGPLARLNVATSGAYRDAALSLQAVATPFSATPFASATAELTGVDASTFDAALPHTRARVHLAFSPQGEGIAGALDFVNEAPGPIDANAIPIAQLAARFALDQDALRLDAIDAVLGGGSAHGEARVALAGAARSVHLALSITDLDLARMQSRLVATRLSGRISADADRERQVVEGDIREKDMLLAFAASIANNRIDVSRFRASAGAGSVSGSAQLALNDSNDFTVRATMERLDPSRFAAVPKASVDGTLNATGAVHPRWRAAVDVGIAPSSRLEGIALSGKVKGALAPGTVSGLVAEVTLASVHASVSGAAGSPGDRLAFTLDAPQLGDIAGLLPASVPHPVAGSLNASGHLALSGSSAGGDIMWRAQALRAGDYHAATLAGHASLAPAAMTRATLDNRALAFDVEATGLALAARTIDTLHASATGSLARHHATLALGATDIATTLALDGSLRNADRPADATWSGTLASLDNRGAVPLHLDGTAALTLRSNYVRIESARIGVADGRADIGEFIWNDGRITTRGSFTGIPVTSAARLAGQKLPLDSTLVVGGDWSIAAAPRLSGRFSLAREQGDVFADVPSGASTKREGIGISELRIAGTFHDDALDAHASFASARAGSASGSASIGSVSGATSGKIDRAAPLRLALRAELASLAVFQPWFGTLAAVDGRAQLDVAAAGSVGTPLWSGTLAASALSVDAPQYGVHVGDGQLHAHLTPEGIALDTLRFRGGDGTFEASGLVALPGKKARAATQVSWKAERFRLANRPDLRFVINGNGSVALADQRLALRGNITVVEGHVEYEQSPTGKLASDIVVEGETYVDRQSSPGKVPLALDIDVDLGSKLTFVGEGVDTRLAGRIRVTTDANGNVRANGTIRSVNGTYIAFGQKLTIDRGRLIFDGPPDNPALDVVALRKNLPVEAGVELSGTVKVPQVRITSNPPVPENEALAWLVTGQGLNGTGRVDYAALSAASAALLGGHGQPFTAGVAHRLGLDDISLQSSSASTSGAQGTASQVVVFGKRISDRLSLGYEQGLSLASSAVRLEYALSRQVTLRAEAGTTSGVAIVYRRSFR
jgi:translocation and assembly module TamB